jgi:hypothetical protein
VVELSAVRARRSDAARRGAAVLDLLAAEALIGDTFDLGVSLRIDAALAELDAVGARVVVDRWPGPRRVA